MKKLLLLIVSLLMAVIGGVASATSVDDLSSLATYYPDNTAVFASIRTDDAYLETLDTLYQHVQTLLPQDAQRGLPLSILPLLDVAAQQLTGDDFEDGVRNWLGDSVAIGTPLNMSVMSGQDFPLLVALEIKDKVAAVAVLERLFSMSGGDNMTVTEQAGFTVFINNDEFDDVPVFAVGDDVAFISTSAEFIPFSGVENSLADKADFTETAAKLPGDDYNIMAYIDAAELQELNLNVMAMTGQSFPPAYARMVREGSVSQVWGVTLADDRTFVMDMASGAIDSAYYDELNMEVMIPGTVDMSFASKIPADAPLVIHGADFGPLTQNALDNLRATGDFLQDNAIFSSLLGSTMNQTGFPIGDAELALLDSFATPDTFMSVLNVSFSGLTGLSLERDVLPVLDGDFAMYLRMLPARNLPVLPAYPDFALLFQSSDSDGAATMMDALIDASEAYDTDYAVEAYGDDGAALVFPLVSDLLEFDYNAFDVLVAQDDDVFTIGSRAAVEAAISDGDSLADDATFQAAGAYLLEGAQQVWYVNLDSFGVVLDDILDAEAENMRRRDVEDMQAIRYVMSLLEHATVSMVTSEDGSAIRLTMTLAEEAVMPQDMESMAFIPEDAGTIYDGIAMSTTDEGFPRLGDADAPVTVVQYSSFSCPFCAVFHEAVVPSIVQRVREGDVNFVFVPYYIRGSIPNGESAARTALCAGEQGQGQFWMMHDVLFDWQTRYENAAFDSNRLTEATEALGLNRAEFDACFRSETTSETLEQAIVDDPTLGTPTVRINNITTDGVSLEQIMNAIDAALAATEASDD